ncbi:MAG: hypothetical protein ACRCWQ_08710 [Bacilli bacterium]
MNIIDELNAQKKTRKYAICRALGCLSEIEFGEGCVEYDDYIFCSCECAHEFILDKAYEYVNEIELDDSHELIEEDGYNVTEDQMRLEF